MKKTVIKQQLLSTVSNLISVILFQLLVVFIIVRNKSIRHRLFNYIIKHLTKIEPSLVIIEPILEYLPVIYDFTNKYLPLARTALTYLNPSVWPKIIPQKKTSFSRQSDNLASQLLSMPGSWKESPPMVKTLSEVQAKKAIDNILDLTNNNYF